MPTTIGHTRRVLLLTCDADDVSIRVVICLCFAGSWSAQLPCGHDPSHSSEHEDETRGPLPANDANNTTSQSNEGERERRPCPPDGSVGLYWVCICFHCILWLLVVCGCDQPPNVSAPAGRAEEKGQPASRNPALPAADGWTLAYALWVESNGPPDSAAVL